MSAALALAIAGALSVGVAPAAPPLSAPADPAGPATDASGEIVLPAGTPVPLVMLGAISSKTHRQGDRFELAVAADVIVGGHVLIPKGSRALGEVTRHVAKGAYGRSGKLELAPLYVTVAGLRIRLDGRSRRSGADAAAGAILAATVIGGLASVVSGKSAAVPAGTALPAFTHRDLVFRIAVPPSPQPPN